MKAISTLMALLTRVIWWTISPRSEKNTRARAFHHPTRARPKDLVMFKALTTLRSKVVVPRSQGA